MGYELEMDPKSQVEFGRETLRGVRAAGDEALRVAALTGTPLIVMQDGKIVELDPGPPQVSESPSGVSRNSRGKK